MERAFYVVFTVAMAALLLHVIAQNKGRKPPRSVTLSLFLLLMGLLVVDFLMIWGVFG